jgi:hypothetical protein
VKPLVEIIKKYFNVTVLDVEKIAAIITRRKIKDE